MPLPVYLLVHTAVPLTYVETPANPPAWIEGEPGAQGGGEPTEGPAFPCVLFMPGPGGEQPNQYRPRVVSVPTLMFNPTREDSSPVVLKRDSELLVTAPELAPWTGDATVRWQLVGDAQPFGPPGSVFGVMAQLRQVMD